jgi:DtxR family Mn-dependent transcriptional regulator
MNVSAKAEEILESLWITTEEKGEDAAHFERLDIVPDDEGLAELVGLAFVEVTGEWVRLRKEGREEARMTVRRHRLAERLMMDILDIKGVTGDERAAHF